MQKKTPEIVRRRLTCDLYADPHARSFSGVPFEAQTEGDWLLYQGENMEAHYRGKRFKNWIGIVQFGVKIGTDIIKSSGFLRTTINGENVDLNDGKEHKIKHGFVVKKGRTTTISTGDGEEIDFISHGWFFNVFVRSNSLNTKGICNQQFIGSKFFTHPHAPIIFHPDEKPCPKRAIWEGHCKKKLLVGVNLKTCIFDLCSGLNKELEDEILREKSKENAIKSSEIVRRRVTCDLFADPHARSFMGKHFEAQTAGDWVLYKGENMEIHYRGHKMGTWVGVVKFGVQIGNEVFKSNGFTGITHNGQPLKLADGANYKFNGGYVHKKGNKYTVSTGDGEEVDFIAYSTFFNAFVRSNAPVTTGLCNQQFVGSKFFTHPEKPWIVPDSKIPACPNKAHFEKHCQEKKLKGTNLHNCIFDLCSGLNPKIEDQILKEKEDENKQIALRINNRGVLVEFDGKGAHWIENGGKKIIRGFGKWKIQRGDRTVDFHGHGRLIKHPDGKVDFLADGQWHIRQRDKAVKFDGKAHLEKDEKQTSLKGDGHWHVKKGDKTTFFKGKGHLVKDENKINLRGHGDWKITKGHGKHKIVTHLKGIGNLTKQDGKAHLKAHGIWRIKKGDKTTHFTGAGHMTKETGKVSLRGLGKFKIIHGKGKHRIVTHLHGHGHLIKHRGRANLKGHGKFKVIHGHGKHRIITHFHGHGHLRKHRGRASLKGHGKFKIIKGHGKHRTVTHFHGKGHLRKRRGRVNLRGHGRFKVIHRHKVTRLHGHGNLTKTVGHVNMKGKGKWHLTHGRGKKRINTHFHGEGELNKGRGIIHLKGKGKFKVIHGDKTTHLHGEGELHKSDGRVHLKGDGKWHVKKGVKVTKLEGQGELIHENGKVHLKGKGDWHITHGKKETKLSGQGYMKKGNGEIHMTGDGRWQIIKDGKTHTFTGKATIKKKDQNNIQ